MTLLLLSLLACGPDTTKPGDTLDGGSNDGGSSDGGSSDGGATDPGELPAAAAARADLRLKRWRQLSLDLETALELPGDALCLETGLYDCRDMHVVPLGGTSVPNGLYDTINTVAATTGLAMERFVLQACWNRAKADKALLEAGQPAVVFSHLSDPMGTSATAEELNAQTSELYRRLLARDPLQAELDALAGLHGTVLAEGAKNADWAVLACFTIGTTTEALTY